MKKKELKAKENKDKTNKEHNKPMNSYKKTRLKKIEKYYNKKLDYVFKEFLFIYNFKF